MCGIIGYIGGKQAYPILIEGLHKLEYKGYDSAGIAVQGPDSLKIIKTKGKVSHLEEKAGEGFPVGFAGFGHLRWATHGAPSEINAHPQKACSDDFALVHNGIIENYLSLRRWLESEGHRFVSETDTEVIAHLIEHYYRGDLLESVQEAIKKVTGSFALIAGYRDEKDRLVCARKDLPLMIGLGGEENFISSDLAALLPHTRKIHILEDGETALVTASAVKIYNTDCTVLQRKAQEITWDVTSAEKGGYEHFMRKEIMEQPQALRETMRGRLLEGGRKINLAELDFAPEEIEKISKIFIVACGTAYHAGLVGKYLLEKILRIPVEVDVASEFRYRDPLLCADTLVIVISQSGETADTLAALRLARERGQQVLAITNVVGSSVAREADKVFFTWAGPEIAVASTKAYLTQLFSLYLLTFYLAQERGAMEQIELQKAGEALYNLPDQVEEILNREKEIPGIASYLSRWESAFFIGRNLDFAVALEGALKLKEISYIHAEAYAAGELKHGALALIVEGIPVVALAIQETVLEKSLSNIKEIKARGGYVFCFAREGMEALASEVDSIFYLPSTLDDIFLPMLAVIPLQFLAYYTAVARGCPVDNPRNLTKSVTVE
ncbi:MAG: glutamine--fructose-6-phosphate transaminase (isomerizing) [Firmicutes bacterium]|nr:glutamine--fructose-6-phosphate transaminase (isomerizing) [Bacillota bacterium]